MHCIEQLDKANRLLGELRDKLNSDEFFSKQLAADKIAQYFKHYPEVVDSDEPAHIESKVKDLDELTKIQCQEGVWNQDPYMHGMANGMLLSMATLQNTSPKYLDAPESGYASDNKVENKSTKVSHVSRLDEVIHRKRELESSIANQLSFFTKRTGLLIDGIGIDRHQTVEGEVTYLISLGVKL